MFRQVKENHEQTGILETRAGLPDFNLPYDLTTY